MSKFTVLCLSSYFVYSFELKLNLFHNKVIYYYTRIFLILLPHSAVILFNLLMNGEEFTLL